MSGLTLSDSSVLGLALQYLAAIQSLAYGTKHILDEMASKGVSFDCILACGGLTRNRLFLQQHADVTNLPFLLAETSAAVSLGAAIAARSAHDSCDESFDGSEGSEDALVAAMKGMSRAGECVLPEASLEESSFHQKKYKVFHAMHKHQLEYRQLMEAPVFRATNQ